MIGESYIQAGIEQRRLRELRSKIEAIALGSGPSVKPWIEAGDIPNVPKYGCSWLPAFLKLDVYTYGDVIHAPDLPRDGTRIVATERAWSDGMERFDVNFPHGGQAGGMAITLACRDHNIIGLIGFDGGRPADHPCDGLLRGLLTFWKARGKKFISLMPRSDFDDLMETP